MARKNLKTVQPIKIILEHGVPMASSLQVAKHFGKDHNHVLRDIMEILKKAPESWALINFEPTFITVDVPNNAVRQDPAFMITRDGFTMLAMGFSGRKAFNWKIKYIEAFNAMEREIKTNFSTFDRSGEPATENQRTMIRYLVDASSVFRYSRGFDVLAYIQDKYAVTGEELDNLTERGADKLILTLIDIMTLLLARTHNRLTINRSFEESCEKTKLQ